MGYDGRVMRHAAEKFESDKTARAAAFEQRRSLVFTKLPRLREIDREIRSTMSRVVATALRRGADPAPAIRNLQKETRRLQEERRRLLQESGYDGDFLEERPNCVLCGDSGYRNGELCRCLRGYYSREQIRELSRLLDLGNQSFDSFSLDWYSETPQPGLDFSLREQMEGTYEYCAHYARHFDRGSENVLMTGAPGLGKTFLSAAIARVVSEAGFSVVYDTAAHVFAQFEAMKFGRDEGEEAEGDVKRCLSCDLLILDDLGTELITAFTQSALYQIINTRLMTGKQTIVSTNLAVADLEKRYSPQLRSRIEGEYQLLHFVGEDIRRLKREREQGGGHR